MSALLTLTILLASYSANATPYTPYQTTDCGPPSWSITSCPVGVPQEPYTPPTTTTTSPTSSSSSSSSSSLVLPTATAIPSNPEQRSFYIESFDSFSCSPTDDVRLIGITTFATGEWYCYPLTWGVSIKRWTRPEGVDYAAGCEIYLHHSFDVPSTCAGPDAGNQTVVELNSDGGCLSFEGEGFEVMVRCSVPDEKEEERPIKRSSPTAPHGQRGGGRAWCWMVGGGSWCDHDGDV